MVPSMDAIDLQILQLLQDDARRTNADIADKVGLSAPSVYERVRKLEQQGVICGYTIHVDPVALGKPLTAFIRLTVAYDERHASGVDALRDDPDVLECYSVAGEDCFIIKTRVATPAALEELIHRIRGRLTVQRSVTMIALSAIKEGGPLAVDEVPGGQGVRGSSGKGREGSAGSSPSHSAALRGPGSPQPSPTPLRSEGHGPAGRGSRAVAASRAAHNGGRGAKSKE
jgi:Lrp/AsnC family leucine-responsive transcriptional regulator